jgi:hypothetical protein
MSEAERAGADLAGDTTAWCDQWWDPAVALLLNPPGSFDADGVPPQSVHLVPQSGWHALGLLDRDSEDDRARAERTLSALCSLQYDAPGTVWHGTFARFLEAPAPRAGAVEWVDYDPNWRQFLGTTFSLVLRTWSDVISPALADRLRAAIGLAIAGEPPDRVPVWYSNIALMRAWLEVEHGDAATRDRAESYAAAVVAHFDEHGAFDEYNSPTYYGVDLWALALWRDHSSSPTLRTAGARLEATLWRDVARWYHAGLGNLCGPFSRAYGMDMGRYAALLGLWIWDAVGADAAPFPALDGPFEHSHDTSLGAGIARLGARVPPDAVDPLVRFTGERTVDQLLGGGRRASGWLADRVMVGAESGGLWPARGQFHPATIHWAAPGGTGWIRFRHPAEIDAVARPGGLQVRARRPGELTLVISIPEPADPPVIGGSRWSLPGLDLTVRADGDGWAVAPSGPVWKVRGTNVARVDLTLD